MKIFIKTYGCTLNQSDSEAMAGVLIEAGHELVESSEQAELVLLNSCTVKDNTEKKFFSELKRLHSRGKRVVAAGCIPQAEPDDKRLLDVPIIGIDFLGSAAEVVEAAARGRTIRWVNKSHADKGSVCSRLELPFVRRNPVVEIIPISAGCLGSCAYCKTRHARGKLRSYPVAAIKKRLVAGLDRGVKEFWLTSQDTGAYGLDIGSGLPELLRELLAVKGDFRIRLGMINPAHAIGFVGELAELFKHKKMFKFLHLPVQSGSDKILRLMNRKYTIRDFEKIVMAFRKAVPRITIATDIVCGFPGESDEDFRQSYELVKKHDFPVLNISKFSPRPGTPAFGMKRVSTRIIKERSKMLSVLHESLDSYADWVGWKGRVLIDEELGDNELVGRNDHYVQTVVKNINKKFVLGDAVEAEVISSSRHCVIAELR